MNLEGCFGRQLQNKLNKQIHAAVTHICKLLKAAARIKVCKRVCLQAKRRKSFFSSLPSVLYFFANAQLMTGKHFDGF
jgi:hypothetical protein